MKYNSAMERSKLISSLWSCVLRARIQTHRAPVVWFDCNSLEKASLRDGTQTNGWDWRQELLAKGYEGMFLGSSNYFTFWCALRLFVLIDCLLIEWISLYIAYISIDLIKKKIQGGRKKQPWWFSVWKYQKGPVAFHPTHTCWVLHDKELLEARWFPSFLLIIWLNAGLMLFFSTLQTIL